MIQKGGVEMDGREIGVCVLFYFSHFSILCASSLFRFGLGKSKEKEKRSKPPVDLKEKR